MNRRQFTTGLSAIAAAPALPVKALANLPAASAAIPHPARFWALYMSHLHGTCSAQTLSKVTGIDASVTQGYLSRLVSEGVLTPTRMASKVLSTKAKPTQKPSGLRERLDKYRKETAGPEGAALEDHTSDENITDSLSVNRDQAELVDETNLAASNPNTQNSDGSY